ncbi:hypothetical protein LguiB_014166 [Lonicera macranthoides]
MFTTQLLTNMRITHLFVLSLGIVVIATTPSIASIEWQPQQSLAIQGDNDIPAKEPAPPVQDETPAGEPAPSLMDDTPVGEPRPPVQDKTTADEPPPAIQIESPAKEPAPSVQHEIPAN